MRKQLILCVLLLMVWVGAARAQAPSSQLSLPVSPANGGFGVSTFGSAAWNFIMQTSGSTGPTNPEQMALYCVSIATPFQFTNGDILYSGKVADGVNFSDVCLYSYSAGTATLIADSGLVHIAAAPTVVALGSGSSNLAVQPSSSKIFLPGDYCQGFATDAGGTTAKVSNALTARIFYTAVTISASAGKCPLTVGSITPTPQWGTSPVVIEPW